jgi:hypothetical protein
MYDNDNALNKSSLPFNTNGFGGVLSKEPKNLNDVLNTTNEVNTKM